MYKCGCTMELPGELLKKKKEKKAWYLGSIPTDAELF